LIEIPGRWKQKRMDVTVTCGYHKIVRSAALPQPGDWAAEEAPLIELTLALNARFGVAGAVD